jgi:hypothetical protein
VCSRLRFTALGGNTFLNQYGISAAYMKECILHAILIIKSLTKFIVKQNTEEIFNVYAQIKQLQF